jgi:hypothetical protein
MIKIPCSYVELMTSDHTTADAQFTNPCPVCKKTELNLAIVLSCLKQTKLSLHSTKFFGEVVCSTVTSSVQNHPLPF